MRAQGFSEKSAGLKPYISLVETLTKSILAASPRISYNGVSRPHARKFCISQLATLRCWGRQIFLRIPELSKFSRRRACCPRGGDRKFPARPAKFCADRKFPARGGKIPVRIENFPRAPGNIPARVAIFLASLQKIFSLLLSPEAESFFANSREPLNFCFARLAKFPGLAEI